VLQAEYSIADNEVKKSVRKDYRGWVDELGKKAEDAAKNNEMPYYLIQDRLKIAQ
jgi:hypothetical protein